MNKDQAVIDPAAVDAELLRTIAINATPVGGGDVGKIEEQLGRVPRGLVGIGARCACGAPAVTVTLPRLPDGTPFPTVFYLTLPYLVREVSRLEAEGEMATMNTRLGEDEVLAQAHATAHEGYIQRREILGHVPEIDKISAGGMPSRVKCLHALVGYSLSVGAGVCPIGDQALDMIGWDRTTCHCES